MHVIMTKYVMKGIKIFKHAVYGMSQIAVSRDDESLDACCPNQSIDFGLHLQYKQGSTDE